MAVGVIVPVRGEAPFLREALRSVLSQDLPLDDVVVVDDASPQPVEIDTAVTGVVRLIRLGERGGPAGARQAGLEALGTDLVALLDADDAWEPGKLAVQVEALDRHAEAALCFGRAAVVGADGAATGERWEEPEAGALAPDGLLPLMYELNPIPTSSVLARRDALVAAGGFASSVPYGVEDWDLWLRLLAREQSFVCEPGARVRYRRHGGGLTADLARLAEASMEIHERHAALVPEEVRRRARAADLTALARGRVRERRYSEARSALAAAARLQPPGRRERVLRSLLAAPGARNLLGRRDPYA